MTGQHRLPVDVLVLIIREGRILLTERAGDVYLTGHWAIPSGKVEAGETVAQAAARELSEEVGLTLNPEELTFVGVTHHHPPDGESRIGFGFAAEIGPDLQPHNAEPHKCSQIAWYAPDALPNPAMAYTREIVRLYLDQEPYSIHHWH